MARKIIQGAGGQRYSVTHADFLAIYQAVGYTEVDDEADPVVYTQPLTYPDVDDAGAWDTGPFYLISAPDGRQAAVTLDNYTNRYQALGWTIGAGEGGEPAPTFGPTLGLLTELGDYFITEAGDYLMQEAA